MAGDINSVVLVGRCTRDGELRYSASGTAICNFSIAVNRRVKRGDQWSDEASFFDLSLWEKQAENLNKYLVKGTQVAVQGELRQERWDKDGKTMSKVAVHVANVQLLGGGKSGADTNAGSKPQREAPTNQADDFDPNTYQDDIPWN